MPDMWRQLIQRRRNRNPSHSTRERWRLGRHRESHPLAQSVSQTGTLKTQVNGWK